MTEVPKKRFFLPDFCDTGALFVVVLTGELLAFVLMLSPWGHHDDWWRNLAWTSLLVQAIGLSSVGLLCAFGPLLARLPEARAGVLAYLLVLALTLAWSEAAYLMLAYGMVSLAPEPMLALAADPSDWQAPLPGVPVDHRSFLVRNLGLAAIVAAAAFRYFYVQSQWLENVEARSLARIEALQARIRPHFLFNSMNTIASLTRSDPALAEQVTEDLADLFRVSLAGGDAPVRLDRELELCMQYLRIEHERLGDRLRIDWRADGCPGEVEVPQLILQPLVENAVYHGIEPNPEGGTVSVHCRADDDCVLVEIANPIAPESVARTRPGNRMAQENVTQRLAAGLGAGAGIEVHESPKRYTVTVRIPLAGRGA